MQAKQLPFLFGKRKGEERIKIRTNKEVKACYPATRALEENSVQ
jgi:hypothetical protein